MQNPDYAKINGLNPAFPGIAGNGMTKRELMATILAAGMLANTEFTDAAAEKKGADTISAYAYEQADSLLKMSADSFADS